MTSWRIEVGDCRDVLRRMPAGSVHTVVTSPPYFGLRDYGTEGQIGLEPTPDEFVAALVDVFRGVRRVLRDDGTVWLNLGDSYAASTTDLGGGRHDVKVPTLERNLAANGRRQGSRLAPGLKPKDLLGVPWLVAFALRADGWYLRSDIVWSKPNPMPESVTDRPTKAHEYVFLLSKRAAYFYDADAIREDAAASTQDRAHLGARPISERQRHMQDVGMHGASDSLRDYGRTARNRRSVWTVATQPYAGAHFATFPPKLIEPCILAGAPERECGECGAPWVRVVERSRFEEASITTKRQEPGALRNDGDRNLGGRQFNKFKVANPDRFLGFEPSCSHGDGSARGVVLDPFAGAGTTGLVALQHGREFVGIELSPEYARMARGRIETAVRLGFRAPQNGREQIPGQLDIFGVA